MGHSLHRHCQNQRLRDYSSSMFHHLCLDTISAFSLAEIEDFGCRGDEHLISLYLAAYYFEHVQLVGLSTTYAAEGYTSEFFSSENQALQVAYPGYREAIQWLVAHTKDTEIVTVGLIANTGTLSVNRDGVGWFIYNSDLPARFELAEAHPEDTSFPYNYLVWPMHLVQRGDPLPEPWRSHIVHMIMGGNTVYCYIMAHSAGSVSL